MKIRFFYFLLPTLLIFLSAHADGNFSPKNTKGTLLSRVSINKSIITNEFIKQQLPNENVYSLSVNGQFTRLAEDYLIRIILKDEKGNEYLVMESYKELYDDKNIGFDNYCEETDILPGVVPDSLLIYVRGGTFSLYSLNCFLDNGEKSHKYIPFSSTKEFRRAQVAEKVKRINEYNKRNNRLWWADITALSLKSFEEKKSILGIDEGACTGGFEYYIGGLFEVGDINKTPSIMNRPSVFVDDFDWRNRHGRNWITPVKSQGGSGYCAAFSAISCAEAWLNMYFNQLVNIDLSEQEAACCNYYALSHDSIYKKGLPLSAPLKYIRDYGVCDEDAYPFVDSLEAGFYCRSNEITPNTKVKINNYKYITSNNDSIKKALIKLGPLMSGIYVADTVSRISHAMAIVGYGTIHAGDTITNIYKTPYGTNIAWSLPISTNDSLYIGKTYWIFKNSYLDHEYYYVLFEKLSSMLGPYSLTGPITWQERNTQGTFVSRTDIICEDADGDGYYYWGIGPKPTYCPSWVPDTPDGDDSDINWGPMDDYGRLQQLSCGYTINTATSYSENQTLSCRIGIVNGGVLTISGAMTMNSDAIIRVCEGGTLIVDGGVILDAKITLVPGSTLTIRNNGQINMKHDTDFHAPTGVTVYIESGAIN